MNESRFQHCFNDPTESQKLKEMFLPPIRFHHQPGSSGPDIFSSKEPRLVGLMFPWPNGTDSKVSYLVCKRKLRFLYCHRSNILPCDFWWVVYLTTIDFSHTHIYIYINVLHMILYYHIAVYMIRHIDILSKPRS